MKNLCTFLAVILIAFSFRLFAKNLTNPNDEISGTWLGKLKVQGTELRIVFHINKNDDGTLSGTMDSPDQGANGIPVDSVISNEGNIRLVIKAVRGFYDGKLNPDNSSISGTWHQSGMSFPLVLTKTKESEKTKQKEETKSQPINKADKEALLGNWLGKLNVSGIELRIVFHIKENEDGTLTATMDSPDQGAKGIPVSSVKYKDGKITLDVSSIGGSYDGDLIKDSLTIKGAWSQGGKSIPVLLKKNFKPIEYKRPQEPEPPFPYYSEDVTFENKSAEITLTGTLTYPKTGGPFPAVLLITGSGPQNRDEEIMGHKPFLVIADYLSRRGIAVLRVDDRGVGKSTGNFSEATTKDFASDALAGVEYLKTVKEINPKDIGLIGHSEGGEIAPMVADETKDVAFIVLLAGPGLRGDSILILQTAAIEKSMGESEENISRDINFNRKVYEVVVNSKDSVEAHEKLEKLFSDFYDKLSDAEKKDVGSEESFSKMRIKQILSPWFRYFISYDPIPALEKVKCPVLALIGSKDLQVPAEENIPSIKDALEKGGNKNFEVKELPGLNHLFQDAKTGSPNEYAQIEETFSPKALKIIGDWIIKITGSK